MFLIKLLKDVAYGDKTLFRAGDIVNADKATGRHIIIELNGCEFHFLKGVDATTVGPKTTTMYLHGDSDTAYDDARDLGLPHEVARNFHPLYEVEVDLEVSDDGKYKILEIRDGEDKFLPA